MDDSLDGLPRGSARGRPGLFLRQSTLGVLRGQRGGLDREQARVAAEVAATRVL